MKKITIVLTIFLILSSCAYHIPLDNTFTSPEEIAFWVHTNIKYTYDWNSSNPSLNEWQSPKETLERGTGDCEDMTLLFMYLCNRDLGIKPDIMLILVDNRIYAGHYIARASGIYYDATHGIYGDKLPYNYAVIDIVKYDIAMLWATKFYTQSVL